MTLVRFIQHSLPHNSGEIAGFDDEIAQRLVAGKVAVLVDAEGNEIVKPVAAEEPAVVTQDPAGKKLEEMTKAELVAFGETIGLELSERTAKAELIETIQTAQAKLAEGAGQQ